MEFVPFNTLAPQHDEAIAEALISAYRGGQFILGERLVRFEEAYARFSGTKHCLGVGNGHDALVMSLRAMGLGTGDEVIVPSNTYFATWLAVINAGCTPVPVEPDAATHNIDSSLIEDAITLKTRAIMPVHLYGNPCDMTSILSIAQRHGLKVIEDNAQAHGASLLVTDPSGAQKVQLTGSFGDVNATSFYPTKNLGALGDGGAVTTDDDEIAARVKSLRNYGVVTKGVCEEAGLNSRLDELQAAVLSVKLERLKKLNEERIEIAATYGQMLRGVGDLVLPVATAGATHVYHLYVVRTSVRDRLKAFLEKKGIQSMVHYPVPPHLQKAFFALGYREGSLPVAEQLGREVLSLPLWPGMGEERVERVWKEVQGFFGG